MHCSRWVPLLLLSPLLFLLGCGGAAQKPPETGPPEVQVSRPVRDRLADHEVFTGRTQAVNSVDLRARVTGYLEKAPFEQGGDVKKGQVLFVLQQRPFKAALAQAKGNRGRMQSQLTYDLAAFERDRKLRASTAASEEEYEKSRSSRDVTRSSLASAEAAVEIAEQNLEWTTLRAPFDGRVSRRLVDPGNDVIADSTILASVVQLDPLYAYFDIDERTLLRIAPMLPRGKVPADARYKLPVTLGLANQRPEDFSYPGELKFADNKVDAGTGTLRMWGTFANPNHALRPGLFVRVKLGIGEPREVLLVAESALGSDQGRRYLYVVGKDNRIVYTPVEVGQRKDGLIAIEKGLKGDERVVVNGLQRVRTNMEVTAKDVKMPRMKR